MSKRCFDILDLPFMSDVSVVAGKEGLKNKIFWVHIAESAGSEEELWSLLKPDDFIIIKGGFLKEGGKTFTDITEKAVELKLSGILVFKNTFMPEIPKTCLTMADQNNIPVFLLDKPISMAVEIQYYMLLMIAADKQERHSVNKIIKDICFGAPENADLRIQRANFLGYNLNRKHSGIIMRITDSDTCLPVQIDEDLQNMCEDSFYGYEQSNALWFVNENDVIALLPWHTGSDKDIISCCRQLLKKIRTKRPELTVVTGIGSGTKEIDRFRGSIVEADNIVQLMMVREYTNEVKTYRDMYADLLLYKLRNDPTAIDMCQSLIEPIEEYDNNRGSNLYKILKTYLAEGRNITQTSKLLYVHRNTLIYQINKIQEITGVNLNNPDDEFKVRMACLIHDLRKSRSISND